MIRIVFLGLQTLYETHLPKVDSTLIHDLLIREKEKSERAPFYMVEIFTNSKINSEAMKEHIYQTTGMLPAIYDNGTHYVTHMRVTPNILKKLNDFDFVEEVVGDYTGSGRSLGPMHDRGEIAIKRKDDTRIKTW